MRSSLIAAHIAFAVLLVTGSAHAQKPAAQAIRFRVAPQGNEARYRVGEQLLDVDLPSDAVGVTKQIDGAIAVGPDGSIISEESRFTINLASLQSDRSMRDNYVRRRLLQTDQFANAVFVPTAFRNLQLPLPKSGDVTFQIAGNLTIRDVTRPITWDVVGKVVNEALTGTAKTTLKFADFQLPKPQVASVLSVEDDIVLEYSFFLVPVR